ncbi:MAG: hypothetical protein U5R30_10360 [Deltaproteobacteria bacterium]|nr:hypothetical protein [Deltaproteobacteria bacterium]
MEDQETRIAATAVMSEDQKHRPLQLFDTASASRSDVMDLTPVKIYRHIFGNIGDLCRERCIFWLANHFYLF